MESYKDENGLAGKVTSSNEYWQKINLLDLERGSITLDIFNDGKYEKKEKNYILNNTLSTKLTSITKNNNFMLYIMSVAALSIELYKYTGKIGTPIGVPVYSAMQQQQTVIQSERMPLINRIDSNQSIRDLLKNIQMKLLEAYEHQYCNIDQVLKRTNKFNDLSELVNVNITINGIHQAEHIESINNCKGNHITINLIKNTSNIEVLMSYNSNMFLESTIDLFEKRFELILEQVITNMDILIKDVNILEEKEKEEILRGFNQTSVSYPQGTVLHQLFEKQVEIHAKDVAIVEKNVEITYEELNKKSNQIARMLRKEGVRCDELVGVRLDRSITFIATILGVLKAGGAYIPIDITYPKDRVEYILEDAKVNILITDRNYGQQIDFTGKIIDVIEEIDPFESEENLENIINYYNLAYAIYTSGSTGKPKGVMIEHGSVVNYITYCQQNYLENGIGDFPLFTSISFDLTVTSIYVPLLSGKKIFVYNNEEGLAFDKIFNAPIDIAKVTPAHLSILNDLGIKNTKIKKFIVGGEELTSDLAERIYLQFNQDLDIINEYGPTEATVGCIVYHYQYKYRNAKTVLIGKPINNTQIYILDKDRQVLPVNVPGELYIAGDGLARGYLNKEQLNAERFVDNPFIPGTKMYKTGDLSKWLEDGNIEFLGRVDNQVKIKGFRIELGEIENALVSHPSIKEAAVVVKEQKADKYLCAYITLKEAVENKEIKAFLKARLPEYMVPLYIVTIEKMPLTSNGKVDRKQLPELNLDNLANIDYEAPTTDMEQLVANIFEEVMGLNKIGISDNFFELGGDSIKAIRIVSKLSNKGYKLQVQDIFNEGTIKAICKKIVKNESNISQDLVVGNMGLTPIQKFFFEQDFDKPNHWNQSVMLYKKDGFEEMIIREVFEALILHHDVLRSTFIKEASKDIQVINDEHAKLYDLTIKDFTYEQDLNQLAVQIREVANQIQGSISLSKGPLVKLGLFKTCEGDHLLIVIHHLVIDGISWRILAEDFEMAYKQKIKGEEIKLPYKTNSFKEWQNVLDESSHSFDQQLEYWKNIEQIQVQELPIDFSCEPSEQNVGNNKQVSFKLSCEATKMLLQRANQAYNTEINDLLLTALGLAIHSWSKMSKIKINLEGHGRERIVDDIDVSRTIGWFTLQYPVVLQIDDKKDIGSLIKDVKEYLRHVPNKGIGYGILRYMNQEAQEVWWGAEPQISFNYLGEFNELNKSDLFELSSLKTGETNALSNKNLKQLDINGDIINQQLGFTITYNGKQYEDETIQHLIEQYESCLLQVINWCKEKTVTEYTPSDYQDATLTVEELEQLKRSYEIEDKIQIEKIYPLSPMQEGMLFHNLIDQSSSAYFEQSVFEVSGEIDIQRMKKSLQDLIQRYDILRTAIVHEGVEVTKQVVLSSRESELYYEDCTQLSVQEQEKYIEEYKKQDRKRGFNLAKECLVRLSILKLKDKLYQMIWSTHHILLDGWSTAVLLNTFFNIYKNKEVQDEEVAQYGDYIKWLNQQDQSLGKQYWKDYLKDYNTVAKISFEKQDIQEKYINKEYEFELEQETVNAINNLGQATQTTLNVMIQAVWGILLQKYTNSTDVVFGSVVSGRNVPVLGIEKMVGLFINTIPVRIKLEEAQSFKALLKEVQKQALESDKFSYYPLVDIKNLVGQNEQLFYSKLTFQNYYAEEVSQENLTDECDFVIDNMSNYEETNYDFNIKVMPEENLKIRFAYNGNKYSEKQVKRIHDHFMHLINQIITKEDVLVSELELVTKEEQKQLLSDFNQTDIENIDETIQHCFEMQVERCPKQIAVIYKEQSLTYEVLNKKANQLAKQLMNVGVQTGDIVGLFVRPSVELLISMIGILKAGAAFLPIHESYPAARIQYMLEDAKVSAVVTETELTEQITYATPLIDVRDQDLYKEEVNNLLVKTNADDLAYVIYTSGTTGKPKGVMIKQLSVMNYSKAMTKRIGIVESDKTALLSSYAFDLGYTAIFTAITNGIPIELIREEEYRNPQKILQTIANGVTYIKITPSMLSMLLECNNLSEVLAKSQLRMIILGGESIRLEDIASFKAKDVKNQVQFVNHYGPTEATIGCLTTVVDEEKIRSNKCIIGKPLDGAKAYILDMNKQLVPIGVIGELYISGKGLAKGYLNRLELTNERFVEWPYKQGEKIYKTGDLARWTEEGEIEFFGRVDHQVKIRGFRIEIGEIESKLLMHEKVKDVIVLAKENEKNNQCLCAYIVSNKTLDMKLLKEYAKEQLPDYMVPTYYIAVNEMPLTANGKVDRKALPNPTAENLVVNEYEQPNNAIERLLVHIWEEVLGIERIGVNDNFFDLGGDSIKAIRIISKLSKDNYQLEIKDLFKLGTIKKVSKYVTLLDNEIDQSAVEGKVALTPIQRMFFESNYTDMHHWNQAVMLYCSKGFDESIIQDVFETICIHHDALRMVYIQKENEIEQINQGVSGKHFDFVQYDFREIKDYEDKIEEKCNEIQGSIDLVKGPIVKVALFKTIEGDHLLVVIHHLVVDGVSWRILLEDFSRGYKQRLQNETIRLQNKTNSFKEWSNYLNQQVHTERLKRQEAYWLDIENTCVDLIPSTIQCDKKIHNLMGDFEEIRFSLTQEQTNQLLYQCNRAYHTETNDLLLTAVSLACNRWAGTNKILIDLEGHGREKLEGNIDINRTVGWFTTHYPLVLSVKSNIGQMIKNIKEEMRNIPDKGIGYGILKYLSLENEWKKEYPQLSFNYLGQFDESIDSDLFEVSRLNTGDSLSSKSERHSDIYISGMIINNQLQVTLNYTNKKYTKESILDLCNEFNDQLIQVIDWCRQKELPEYTPSDYSDADITIEELEEFIKKQENQEAFKIKDIYGLTPMQEGMLFHSLLEKDEGAYFEQKEFTIKGKLDISILEQSFNKMLQDYDILRTVISYEDFKAPKQIVIEPIYRKVMYKELTLLDKENREIAIKDYLREDRAKGFILNQGNLIRLAVLKVDRMEYRVVLSYHHILMDGWSSELFLRRFFAIYIGLLEKQMLPNTPVSQFVNYILWLKEQNKLDAKVYWEKYLTDYVTIADFNPKNRDENVKFVKEELVIELEEQTTQALQQLSTKQQVTLNVLLQAAWGILLQKYNNSLDVVFGAVVSGRDIPVEEAESILGLFINIVPVRIKIADNQTFKDVVKQRQIESLEANKYDYFPLADIQALTDVKQKLINTIIIYENYDVSQQVEEMIDFEITDLQVDEQNNYDISLTIIPDSRLRIKVHYNSKQYDCEKVQEIMSHYQMILETVINNQDILIRDVDILTQSDKKQLINTLNDTALSYESDKTINELFEAQVRKNGEKIALAFENQTLTYNELDARANSLAKRLREKGVQPDEIVGIIMDRSIEMIIAIMGILKSGAAYLPIDPEFPMDRIEYIIKDSNISIIVMAEKNDLAINFVGSRVNIDINDEIDDLAEPVEVINKSHNLAYVLYTSGSTGNPKGVMVEHKQVNNFIAAMIHETKMNQYETILCITTISFDIFGLETLLPLTQGMKVVITSKNESLDANAVAELIQRHNISIMQTTPSRYKMFLENKLFKEALNNLKIALVGGEELPQSLADELVSYKNMMLFNVYGPTETTIWSTIKEIKENQPIVTIGKPIGNTQIYILDNYQKLVPQGVVGELCIAGDGVTRGYLHKEELTREKFIKDPFKQYGYLYRTGDLARWNDENEIEFLGRMDNQVKIRGYRIELGEIEKKILECNGIKDSLVVAKSDTNGQKYLCAYYLEEDGYVDKSIVKKYLQEQLPNYMVPSYFIDMQEFPMTPNGKIDRKRLPNPILDGVIANDYEKARNELDQKLIAIWQEVLQVEKIGINDDFFDLGGHSLKATIMIGKIHKVLNVEVPLQIIFAKSNIKELSNYIAKLEKTDYMQIVPCKKQPDYVASAAQKSIYMVQQLDPESTAYNMPSVYEIKGDINIHKIEETFKALIKRHEVLRTSFMMQDNDIRQIVHDEFEFKVTCHSIDQPIEEAIEMFITPFDLSKQPLIRADIVDGVDKKYLVLDMHHIISDGTSINIILNDFIKLYKGEILEELTLQYKDYSQWEEQPFNKERLNKQEEYWLDVYKKPIQSLRLPYDFERPENSSFRGERYRFEIGEEQTYLLRELVKEKDITMHMLLLAVFSLLLNKYSGQDDIIIGTPVSGRTHESVQNMVGMFVNTLAIRNQPREELTFSEFLHQVKENLLNAYNNQNYQFQELVSQLNLDRVPGRNPLIDVMFSMNNIDLNEIKEDVLEDIILCQYPIDNKISKFDLTLAAYEKADTIQLEIEYSTELFKEETIEQLKEDYCLLVQSVLENTEQIIEEISLISEKEEIDLENEREEVNDLRNAMFTF